MQRIDRQACELRLAQMKKRLVVASPHVDLRLRLDAVVDDDVQSIACADGGHSAMCAVGEQSMDLMFIGHVDIVTESSSQVRYPEVV